MTTATLIFNAVAKNQISIRVRVITIPDKDETITTSRCFRADNLSLLEAAAWVDRNLPYDVAEIDCFNSSSVDFAKSDYGWTLDAHEQVNHTIRLIQSIREARACGRLDS